MRAGILFNDFFALFLHTGLFFSLFLHPMRSDIDYTAIIGIYTFIYICIFLIIFKKARSRCRNKGVCFAILSKVYFRRILFLVKRNCSSDVFLKWRFFWNEGHIIIIYFLLNFDIKPWPWFDLIAILQVYICWERRVAFRVLGVQNWRRYIYTTLIRVISPLCNRFLIFVLNLQIFFLKLSK